ncbi:MAG: LysE family translocator [Desulfuromonadaceae bacterium]|nr:LysE family translocator [Desulfuromonadaceae bacterium]
MNLALFLTASWVLILTPGPDMIYVITRGVSQGRKAGMISAVGVTLGILVHTLFAAFGLAIILRTSSLAFLAVKIAGALYLIYLGIKTIKQKSDISFNKKKTLDGTGKVFFQGVLTNLLNPKIALFFLAFLPQFVIPDKGHESVQMLCLGLTYALFCIIFLVFVGYFSGRIGSWLSRKGRLEGKIRCLSGSVFIVLGLRLIFMKGR